MSKKGTFLGYLVFAVLIIVLYFAFQDSGIVSEDIASKIFVVEKGEGLKEISEKLEQEGLISSSKLFQAYTFLRNARKNLLPGEFHLEIGTSFKNLLKNLTNQPLASEVEVTIVEGLTNKEIAVLLEQKGLVMQNEFFSAIDELSQNQGILSQYEFLTALLSGGPDAFQNISVEEIFQGYFFPDTYRFYQQTSARAILLKMLDNFDQKVDQGLRSKIKQKNKTMHEIITLASIVEKEVHLEQDRRLVADIFWKRLSVNWALESDATVNYILNSSKLRPSFEDTRTSSPYNTYLNPGLPPGPINNPSLSAIRAVIEPIENDYCCFLTSPEGQNVFSRTVEEHNRNKSIHFK